VSVGGCRLSGEFRVATECLNLAASCLIIDGRGSTRCSPPILRKADDHLEVAQFVYLILNNSTLRDVIDTIRAKAVLILGRFTPERKAVLDALRDTLRTRNYSPIVFDFEAPATLNLTETVSTLARLARFVIADITDAKSIPQELMAIVPQLPSVPIQPLLLESDDEYGMFGDFLDFPSVLEIVRYHDANTLIANLDQLVIRPAETFAEMQVMRRQSRQTQRKSEGS
jgi:hypothetical protein